jgi:hypothetical protein
MLLFLPKRWRNLMLLHWKTWPHGIMLMLADIMQLPKMIGIQCTLGPNLLSCAAATPPDTKTKNYLYIYNIIELIN